MKIRFLGTGYGECKIKKRISKDYRKHGGILVDENILIDAPLDIFEVAEELGIGDLLAGVSSVIISHSHPSHFSPEAVARLSERKKINVYATRPILSAISPSKNLTMYEITEFTEFELFGYGIIALPTNHSTDDPDEKCLNFLLHGNKTLFYALDGGWIRRDVFEYLKSHKIDAVICDCALETESTTEKNFYHNDIYTVVRIKNLFSSANITHEKSRFILSHLPSPRKRSIHDELSPIAADHGLTMAYDGYFLKI